LQGIHVNHEPVAVDPRPVGGRDEGSTSVDDRASPAAVTSTAGLSRSVTNREERRLGRCPRRGRRRGVGGVALRGRAIGELLRRTAAIARRSLHGLATLLTIVLEMGAPAVDDVPLMDGNMIPPGEIAKLKPTSFRKWVPAANAVNEGWAGIQ
jgi:hypothetical protein